MVCSTKGAIRAMKIFEQLRIKRQEKYEGLFSAPVLFISGLLAMPALLFNPYPPFRLIQFLFFWFLCWLAGRRNKPLITIFIILVIIGFNLIVPYGEILFSIGRFRITLGAFMSGLQKAVTLQGLIMLSRLSIRQDLKIPGSFGELIGDSFSIFAQIMESKKRITRKNLMEDIDQLMIDLSLGTTSNVSMETQTAIPARRTKLPGFIIITLVLLITWLIWALAMI